MKSKTFSIKELKTVTQHHTADAVKSSVIEMFCIQNKITVKNNELIKKFVDSPASGCDLSDFDLSDIHTVILILELLNSENRTETGIVFTPKSTARLMAKLSLNETSKVKLPKVLDPAAGCGSLLVETTKELLETTEYSCVDIIENSLYAIDINKDNVEALKIVLCLLALNHGEDARTIKYNILHEDTIKTITDKNYKFSEKGFSYNSFDIVIANPPYVKYQNMKESDRANLREHFDSCKKGNFNLYFTFFEIAKLYCKLEGKSVLITPNEFLRGKSSAALRNWLLENKLITEIIDFKAFQIFPTASTYTCISILGPKQKKANSIKYLDAGKGDISSISKRSEYTQYKYAELEGQQWHLMDKKSKKNINLIKKQSVPLTDIITISYGLATLRDKLYTIPVEQKSAQQLSVTYEGEAFPIEKKITHNMVKVSTAKTQKELETMASRVIFPYNITDNKATILKEETLKEFFPNCYAYFCAIKPELAKRDHGKKTYDSWFAYGRSQGLLPKKDILLTPLYAKNPRFMLQTKSCLFLNGCAIDLISKNLSLKNIQIILNSDITKYFVEKVSTPLQGGYYSYQKPVIANFSIPQSLLDTNLEKKDPESHNRLIQEAYKIKL